MNFESGQFGYSSNRRFLFRNAHELGFSKVLQFCYRIPLAEWLPSTKNSFGFLWLCRLSESVSAPPHVSFVDGLDIV